MSTNLSADPTAGAGQAVASQRAGSLHGVVAGAVLLTLTFGWVFWHFIQSQLRWAIGHQADWGHTLIIPVIAGYFVYRNRHRLADTPLRTTWFGLVPIVVGVAWYVLCWLGPQAIRHHNLQGAGVGLTLFGIVLLFAGFRAMRWLWFPIAYLCIFGQTISDRLLDMVTFKLQDITAVGSYGVLSLMTIDIERTGNILTVFAGGEERPLNIAEACSGMRMLMAFLALGVAMAYTGLPHLWQRVVLVALGVPVAIAVNILRVVTIAILAIFDADLAAGDFHTFVGLLWLVPAFVLYLGIMWVLKNLVIDTPPAGSGETPA